MADITNDSLSARVDVHIRRGVAAGLGNYRPGVVAGTGGTYLHAVIPIAALGLIAVVVAIGQLIWK
jgi:hypothetical protein